jgi:type IV pilus assembly protein PilV
MKTLNQHTPASQHGMSLIEVMVAVFVVSVGLLGVARMEILAKQSNVEAIQRTAATQLAQQIITKMRANPSQLTAYEGQILGAGKLKLGTNCATTTCTSAELAAWDLYQWEQALMGASEKTTSTGTNAGGLDSPRGCITGPAGGGVGEYVISIAWRGKSPMTNPTSTTCGNGLSLYGTNDEYRRVLTLTLYISNTGA